MLLVVKALILVEKPLDLTICKICECILGTDVAVRHVAAVHFPYLTQFKELATRKLNLFGQININRNK